MANFKNRNAKREGNTTNQKFTKPKFKKVNVAIADSNFYRSNLDSLYNLLCSISFDKVAVPVYMSKSELFGNAQLKGTAVFGVITKFNNDNTLTVSVQENLANKFIEGEHVMSIRCKKDYDSGEITYVNSFCIVKGKSIHNDYEDIEKAMYEAAGENECVAIDVILDEDTEDYPKAEITE